MKQIPYKVKDVKAGTEYRDLLPADRKYLLDKLREIAEIAEGCSTSDQPGLQKIGSILTRPNKNIPRMSKAYGGGMNSIRTAANGIVDNIENGTQRDFSNRTCEIVERTFSEIIKTFSDWEEVEFVKTEVLEKPKLEVAGGSIFDPSMWEMVTTFRKRTSE